MLSDAIITLEPTTQIINALQSYCGIVANYDSPDFPLIDFGCISFQGGVLIPYYKDATKSKILPDNEEDYIDLMHDYIGSFFDYEEFDSITKNQWLGGSFPTMDMCSDGITSTPPEFNSLLVQYVEENDINAVDLPFIIGCLIASIGLNDEHGRCDETGTMGDWFVSRFRFDLQNCF